METKAESIIKNWQLIVGHHHVSGPILGMPQLLSRNIFNYFHKERRRGHGR